MQTKTYPAIPQYVWDNGIESICVDFWWSDNLKQHINAKLPSGWRFLSHVICERDSFGPVTSLLRLISPTGITHEGFN